LYTLIPLPILIHFYFAYQCWCDQAAKTMDTKCATWFNLGLNHRRYILNCALDLGYSLLIMDLMLVRRAGPTMKTIGCVNSWMEGNSHTSPSRSRIPIRRLLRERFAPAQAMDGVGRPINAEHVRFFLLFSGFLVFSQVLSVLAGFFSVFAMWVLLISKFLQFFFLF
jgi:hypothetical protein